MDRYAKVEKKNQQERCQKMSKKGQKGEKKRKVKESLKDTGGKARTKKVRDKDAKSKK